MKISLLSMVLVVMSLFTISDRAESIDITKTIQGTVKQIKANSVRVLSDDSNGSEVLLTIDSNTVYDNVQKLTDLKAGDKVQIDYQTKQSKNIAITIKKMEVESGG